MSAFLSTNLRPYPGPVCTDSGRFWKLGAVYFYDSGRKSILHTFLVLGSAIVLRLSVGFLRVSEVTDAAWQNDCLQAKGFVLIQCDAHHHNFQNDTCLIFRSREHGIDPEGNQSFPIDVSSWK